MDGEQTEQTAPVIDLAPAIVSQEESKPLVPVTAEEAWAAIESTRYYAPMDKRKFEAKQKFGEYLVARLNSEALIVNVFESIELLQENMRVTTQVATNEKAMYRDRVAAVLASASASRSLLEMTEKAEEMVRKKNPEKRFSKNLPPAPQQNLILAQNVTMNQADPAKNGSQES